MNILIISSRHTTRQRKMAKAKAPSDFEIRVVYGDKDLSEIEKPWSPTWRLIREAFMDVCLQKDCPVNLPKEEP